MAGIDLSGVVRFLDENILLDTVRVAAVGAGSPVFNEETGEYDYPTPAVLYEGPGAVQPLGARNRQAIQAVTQPWVDEATVAYQLLTPLTAPVPGRDHLVTVTAVHAGGDTALLGRRWRAQDPGKAATIAVVRVTPLDQEQLPAGGV